MSTNKPLEYLATHRVTGYRETPIPPSYRSRADGYGSRIPCRAWLELDGKRWHRVFAICWGTGATQYINVGGDTLHLRTGDLNAIIARCGLTAVARPVA